MGKSGYPELGENLKLRKADSARKPKAVKSL